MTTPRKILYSLEKFFWSIYFVITLALIGFFMGYATVCSLLLIAKVTEAMAVMLGLKFLKNFSERLMIAAEYIQCWSIYLLLKIQPWLYFESNFQSIYGFYDRYKTRNVMVVANHRSNLDTFLMIALIPGLRGMAKKSLFYNIFFAPPMLLNGFVPVNKGNLNSFFEGLKLLQKRILMKNRPALVFPETTRCQKNFVGIGKFSDAVFKAAMEAKTLVLPVLIEGTDQVLGRGDFFIRPGQRAKLTLFDPVIAQQFKSEHELSVHVKKLLLASMPCS